MHKHMDEFIYILLDNGYDHLPSIACANEGEIAELQDLFRTPDSKSNIKALVQGLKELTVEKYRSDPSQLSAIIAKREEVQVVELQRETTPQIEKEDYLSIRRVGLDLEWEDKYFRWTGNELQWFQSKRSTDPEETIDLSDCHVSLGTEDSTSLRLTIPDALGKPYKALELAFVDNEHSVQWLNPLKLVCRGPAPTEPIEEEVVRSPSESLPPPPQPRDSAESNASSAPPPPPGGDGAAVTTSATGVPLMKPPPPSAKRPSYIKPVGIRSSNGSMPPPPPRSGTGSLPPPPPPSGDEEQKTSPDVGEDLTPGEMIRRSSSRRETISEKRRRKYVSMLTSGAIFKKYKHGKGSKRCIWCTPALDHVLWGDTDKGLVRGFLRTANLTEVTKGNGSDKRIFLLSTERTLELEAQSFVDCKEWLLAFQFLLEAQITFDEKQQQRKAQPGYKEDFEAAKQAYAGLLTRGDVFKKWPHKMGFHKSSSVRKVWCTPNLDQLQWGDTKSLKVKGNVLIHDIVDIIEDSDPKNENKFALVCKDRYLNLEAKDEMVKKQWVQALRFFLDHK